MQFFNTNRLDALHAPRPPEPARKILIVDDEPANRQAICSLLAGQYQLLEAENGLDALQLIESLPDKEELVCIISDQRMPLLTGVELFERLLPVLPRTIRIIVTGFIDVDAIVDAVNRAHIYQFFIKPFDPQDFILTVKRAVEAHDLQKKLDSHHALLENRFTSEFKDPLTGLPNRRFVYQHIVADTPPCQAGTLMLLDYDSLTHGHADGGQPMADALHQALAKYLASRLGKDDLLIRWRDTTLLLVLPPGSPEQRAIYWHKAVLDAPFLPTGQRASCSIGFASLPFIAGHPDWLNWEQVLHLAEQALFQAQAQGDNLWWGWQAQPGTSLPPRQQLLYAPMELVQQGQLRILSNRESAPCASVQPCSTNTR